MDGEHYRNLKENTPSIHSSSSSGNSGTFRRRQKKINIWRPKSLVNLFSTDDTQEPRVLNSAVSTENISNSNYDTDNPVLSGLIMRDFKDKKSVESIKKLNKNWDTIVTIVIVEAKGLPDPPIDGFDHTIFCKISLGSDTYKSRAVPNSHHPVWRERYEIHMKDTLLKVSLWDKGSQKFFMGSCVIDLSKLEKERTHEIWQDLDDGYGSLHLNLTMCTIRNNVTVDQNFDHINNEQSLKDVEERFAFYNLKDDWKTVGQLFVYLIGAKGLSGKPSAYCALELDNERVQTHSVRACAEPEWHKNYVFNVYDVTSTLDLKVYDRSIMNSLGAESLGKVSIPLLRIRNGETRWYTLKDRNKRHTAKGNCPRVLMKMSMYWNPVKATIRLFQPKEIKYIKKSPKFDLGLVYGNMEFVRDTLHFAYEVNESFKRFLEWENRELCATVLAVWLIFWYHFPLWATPLIILMPFIYFWVYRGNDERSFSRVYVEDPELNSNEKVKNDKTLTARIQALPDMTLTITTSIEFITCSAERLYNLLTFKVPFLSYLAMIFLVMATFAFYLIPVNYMIMALGVYKYTRKYLNPNRTLNNDIVDFISRIPDHETLKDWKELSVPEPVPRNYSSQTLTRSSSSYL